MKVATEIVVGREYIIVFEDAPVRVRAGTHRFENANRSFSRRCDAWELPEPAPVPPATVKVRIKQLRGILWEAEKLQARISTVASGTMKVVFGDNAPFDVSEEQAKELRASTLRKLGVELNALLTLKADAVDETDAT